MRKLILSAATCVAMVGVALAQVEASSSVYFVDVDPARYAGPVGQRVMLRVGDQPRHVSFGAQDDICVQLQRVAGEGETIAVRVRSLGPDARAADVRVVAPDIAPGTYRSTPWGLLVRAVPGAQGEGTMMKTSQAEAPVCTLDEGRSNENRPSAATVLNPVADAKRR